MIPLNIIPNCEGAFPELQGAPEYRLESVGAIARGTAKGRAVVCLVLRAPDGSYVFAQTTLRLFKAAAAAMAARHPDDGSD